ncbi:MAG: 2-hydroxyacid dehydrogenase [Pseudomonadota bacterium]
MTETLMIAPMPEMVAEQLRELGPLHDYAGAADKDALLAEIGPHVTTAVAMGGFPGELHDRLPNLQLISSYGVGYDGIDVPLASRHGVAVTNTPDVLSDAVAELTVGMMLAYDRMIPQAETYVRAGDWAAKGMFPLTRQLAGSKAGIFGLGRIGKEVASRLSAMKVEVAYHGRREQAGQPYRYYASLAEMAADVDWLVSIAPGGAETHHAIDAEVLRALGPDGRVLNIGRGSVIDEAALVAALKAGEVGGAALDVFEDEPRPNPDLLTMSNVLLQPHNGSATHATRQAMGQLVVDNVKAHLAGAPLLTKID